MGFGDLGRKLGEMWHALEEDSKEDFRKRARDVAEARMRAWKKQMAALPRHKQLEAERIQVINCLFVYIFIITFNRIRDNQQR